MGRINLHTEEIAEVIESLTYSTELLGLSCRDLQALGMKANDTVKKVLRQVDAIDVIIERLNDCQTGKNRCRTGMES